MKFEEGTKLPLLVCANPHKFRAVCKGFLAGFSKRGLFLYWGYEFSEYNVKLQKGRENLDQIRMAVSLFLWILFTGLFIFFVLRQKLFDVIFTSGFWVLKNNFTPVFFWISVFFAAYFVYRLMLLGKITGEVEKYSYKKRQELEKMEGIKIEWEEIAKIPKNKHKDISKSFDKTALFALGDAYLKALSKKSHNLTVEHIFFSLITHDSVAALMFRLGIPVQIFKEQYETIFLPEQSNEDLPEIGEDFYQVMFKAYEKAFEEDKKQVGILEIFLCCVEQSSALQELLYGLNVEERKLDNVASWFVLREKLRQDYLELKKAASFRSKYGIDRAMTAVATPLLNNFSEDITMAAKFGALLPCIDRKEELKEIFRIIDGGRQSVLLVGDYGVGKRTIIEGLADLMIKNRVPERLFDKRMVSLSLSSLLAGTTPSGVKERINMIMQEIAKAKNVILFIENLDELLNSEGNNELGIEVAKSLQEFLGKGEFLTFATASPDGYKRFISGSSLGSAFEVIEVKEIDDNVAIQILESRITPLEIKNDVFFTYNAIEKSVELARKLMRQKRLPESALEIVAEVASYTHNKSDKNKLVTEFDVGDVVSKKTGVPASSIKEDEKNKLLNLEEELHKRVIGQDGAVSLVASALKRARAEVRSEQKPISVFLFLGPTGVGKTELAKALSSIYFGNEANMVRVDMSEYQDTSSIYRLIGAPNQKGTGILTEAVIKQPFSLVLLDELEKAHKDVLNLFLQVFDDGRLTDSVGRVVDFTNTIIIATSNAGTAFAQKELNSGKDVESVRQELIRGELAEFYAPEFLNRFDAVVLFKNLQKQEIKQIASLMLKRIEKTLEEKGVELVVEDVALNALADVGYDPDFGARPMRRVIQDKVETQLADLMLQNKIDRGSKVILGDKLELKVE